MYSLIILYVTRSFGLYAAALLAILSSGTLPSPSPNSTFTLITLSFFVGKHYYRLNMHFFVQTNRKIFPTIINLNSIIFILCLLIFLRKPVSHQLEIYNFLFILIHNTKLFIYNDFLNKLIYFTFWCNILIC